MRKKVKVNTEQLAFIQKVLSEAVPVSTCTFYKNGTREIEHSFVVDYSVEYENLTKNLILNNSGAEVWFNEEERDYLVELLHGLEVDVLREPPEAISPLGNPLVSERQQKKLRDVCDIIDYFDDIVFETQLEIA